MPVCLLDGVAITTVEGIGSTETKLHPIQERIAKVHGTQCGYCTPGFVMSMYALLRNNPQPTPEEIELAFEGNLCRCTGYRPILEGCKTFCGKDIVSTELYNPQEFSLYDPSQELIFPPELLILGKKPPTNLTIFGNKVTWVSSISFDELISVKQQYPNSKLVGGHLEIGINTKYHGINHYALISTANVNELNNIEKLDDGVLVGSSVTISRLMEELERIIIQLPEYKTRIFSAFITMLKRIGCCQVRNVASLAGNLVTARSTSDLCTILVGAKCQLRIKSLDGSEKQIVIDDTFFTNDGKCELTSQEILTSIVIPFSTENEYMFCYKQSRRYDNSFAIVNAGLRVILNRSIFDTPGLVKDCTLAYGGMGSKILIAKQTSSALIGREWNLAMLEDAIALIGEDLPLPFSAKGGATEYRKVLAASFFFKFFMQVLSEISAEDPNIDSSVKTNIRRCPSKGIQIFEKVNPKQVMDDALRRPIVHLTALQQTTGEAQYLMDIPEYKSYTNTVPICRYLGVNLDELHASIVLSERAHAIIESINYDEAISLPGVHEYISAKDVPGSNRYGEMANDEYIFSNDKVTSHGQMIGMIIAESKEIADEAVKLVKISYKDLPAILTIEDAIKEESIFETFHLTSGNIQNGFLNSHHIIEDEIRMGGQEHFYMENQCVIVTPKAEAMELDVHVATQCLDLVQSVISETLAIPMNCIVCHIKRIGGSFGGKNTRIASISAGVAVAARKLKRPIRLMIDRHVDMAIKGSRAPYLAKYKVGFNNDGHIQAIQIRMYSNSGYSRDLSLSVMNYSMIRLFGSYMIENCDYSGSICQTNISSTTAFRGFGAPQAIWITEKIMTEVANRCEISQRKVREMCLHIDGYVSPFNQKLETCQIRKVWDELIQRSDYDNRKQQIEIFNKKNRFKKRGIAIIPSSFGIGYLGFKFMEQAGALIQVYTDGSLLLFHGGIEIGQGLNTKLVQICSHILGVPKEKIHLIESSTAVIPNATETSNSSATDLYGAATKDACEKLKERLDPIRATMPTANWVELIIAAYYNRVNLSAAGYFVEPNPITFSFETKTGRGIKYYTYGASVSEVEIDTLTGDHQNLRTDIVMDVGKSLNPAIDIGQVEGGFVQGIGLYTIEQLYHTPEGIPLMNSPENYKIPTARDIPREFQVALIRNSFNDKAIYSSKAIGEPTLPLATSVFLAIQNAVQACRLDRNLSKSFEFNSPATAERIRMACQDNIISKVHNL
ncbi:uncharacterized protein TRIADDRAFT_57138 [Trichoplax adhaerens]|uniref:xanthine dehydrogenase n=1 Tax=Trichoplax adhaerens TaxID=10228 RepID=B3S0Q7_TRIAD|nr:hypothetical protein TRIADDRAFT_57138 [Trichoplax adhaerens]EDV24048.1 hypothetical protein TRIADDRAFT_57138 [Trichoplax adhaerens]|eukprot:XP_002113574.1 hypothetical protein TRIADDRAFT_57138 [Trichoplax adhaerens]